MIRAVFRLFAFGIAGWAILVARDSYGYALENDSWPAGTTITMQMEMGAVTATLQDGSLTWNEAAVPALDDWNAVMGDVHLVSVMDSTKAISSGDGINTASFASTVFGDSFGKDVLAVTYYLTQGGTIVEADVLFNEAQSFDSYRGPLQFDSHGRCICDIQRVFLHEMGHALGLDHPDSAGQDVLAIMNSVVSDLDQLAADDIAGIQFLYGAPQPSSTPTPSPGPFGPSRLINISTRMAVGTGNNVMIAGFIIQGSDAEQVVLRAIGPSLGASGISGAIQDPQIELYDSAGSLLSSNDNWQASPDSAEIIDSGLAPSDPREAAIVATLPPGNYTAIVSGVNNETGIGLVESYALDTNASHAANISTRGRVAPGEEVLIGGFIIGGQTTKKIIVRALGPSLLGSGLTVLADPMVELHGSDGQLIATNGDWGSGGQASEIASTGLQPDNPKESALIVTIPSGNYTAIVQGENGGAGIALVEIYDLDL